MKDDQEAGGDGGVRNEDETRLFWPEDLPDCELAFYAEPLAPVAVDDDDMAADEPQDAKDEPDTAAAPELPLDGVCPRDPGFLRKMAEIAGAAQAEDVAADEEQTESAAVPHSVPLTAGACEADEEKRELDIVVSTSRLDRQGDRIETAGLDFTNYRNNPVVLWAHDLQRPPVGRVVRLETSGGEVRARVQFADTPFAREVFSLYAGGYLNAWSVGFLPRRWERLPAEQGGGVHVFEAEVVEISAVPVPANPEALTKALERAGGARRGTGRGLSRRSKGATVSLRQAARRVASLLGRLAGESVERVSRPC